MAFGHFVLQARHGVLHDGCGLVAQVLEHSWIDLDLGRASAGLTRAGRMGLTPQLAQLVRPHRHCWQRRRFVFCCLQGNRNGRLKCIPHRQQLAARGVQQRRKLGIHAGPVRIGGDLARLGLPVRHVGA